MDSLQLEYPKLAPVARAELATKARRELMAEK